MMMYKNKMISSLLMIGLSFISTEATAQNKTYCNPINLDYGYCPIPDFVTQGKHPVIVQPTNELPQAHI